MTTEDDFQAALDANPDDWQTRLVLADWLDERGDPRGPGYRALGRHRLAPLAILHTTHSAVICYWDCGPGRFGGHSLPTDWLEAVSPSGVRPYHDGRLGGFVDFRSSSIYGRSGRGMADDCAAFGFAQLPAARRAELLALTPAA